jgi:hypothetical protein
MSESKATKQASSAPLTIDELSLLIDVEDSMVDYKTQLANHRKYVSRRTKRDQLKSEKDKTEKVLQKMKTDKVGLTEAKQLAEEELAAEQKKQTKKATAKKPKASAAEKQPKEEKKQKKPASDKKLAIKGPVVAADVVAWINRPLLTALRGIGKDAQCGPETMAQLSAAVVGAMRNSNYEPEVVENFLTQPITMGGQGWEYSTIQTLAMIIYSAVLPHEPDRAHDLNKLGYTPLRAL